MTPYGSKRYPNDRVTREGASGARKVRGQLPRSLWSPERAAGVGPLSAWSVSGVTGPFELLGQLRATGGHDVPADQHVDHVGPQLHQQAMKVGDGQYAQPPFGGRPLQAAGHRAQRVDVETRVDFVEDAERGAEHSELHHLVALSL